MNKYKKLFKSLTDHEIDKVIDATLMLEHSPTDEVITSTGVERKYLEAGVEILERPEWLDDRGKPNLLPTKYYTSLRKEINKDKLSSTSDFELRFQSALNEKQNACEHKFFFVRCTKCMKVLGSELNYFSYETIFRLIRDVEYDMRDPLGAGNDERREFALAINDRLQKIIITKLEHEDTEFAELI